MQEQQENLGKIVSSFSQWNKCNCDLSCSKNSHDIRVIHGELFILKKAVSDLQKSNELLRNENNVICNTLRHLSKQSLNSPVDENVSRQTPLSCFSQDLNKIFVTNQSFEDAGSKPNSNDRNPSACNISGSLYLPTADSIKPSTLDMELKDLTSHKSNTEKKYDKVLDPLLPRLIENDAVTQSPIQGSVSDIASASDGFQRDCGQNYNQLCGKSNNENKDFAWEDFESKKEDNTEQSINHLLYHMREKHGTSGSKTLRINIAPSQERRRRSTENRKIFFSSSFANLPTTSSGVREKESNLGNQDCANSLQSLNNPYLGVREKESNLGNQDCANSLQSLNNTYISVDEMGWPDTDKILQELKNVKLISIDNSNLGLEILETSEIIRPEICVAKYNEDLKGNGISNRNLDFTQSEHAIKPELESEISINMTSSSGRVNNSTYHKENSCKTKECCEAANNIDHSNRWVYSSPLEFHAEHLLDNDPHKNIHELSTNKGNDCSTVSVTEIQPPQICSKTECPQTKTIQTKEKSASKRKRRKRLNSRESKLSSSDDSRDDSLTNSSKCFTCSQLNDASKTYVGNRQCNNDSLASQEQFENKPKCQPEVKGSGVSASALNLAESALNIAPSAAPREDFFEEVCSVEHACGSLSSCAKSNTFDVQSKSRPSCAELDPQKEMTLDLGARKKKNMKGQHGSSCDENKYENISILDPTDARQDCCGSLSKNNTTVCLNVNSGDIMSKNDPMSDQITDTFYLENNKDNIVCKNNSISHQITSTLIESKDSVMTGSGVALSCKERNNGKTLLSNLPNAVDESEENNNKSIENSRVTSNHTTVRATVTNTSSEKAGADQSSARALEMVEESSCGPEMVVESSCGPEMVEESSCGPEMVVESSCGPEMVVESSCGPEMVKESSCGPEIVEESSCGPEMVIESSCGPEMVVESSCGPEMVKESSCGPEMVEKSFCAPKMVVESFCGPQMVKESSCGPEMVKESSCGPEMVEESSCGPEMVEESSCGPEMVEESSCGPEMVEESSCGPKMVVESSCAPEMVEESSCGPEMVEESSCGPEMVVESSCGLEMVVESSYGPEMVKESSSGPEMVEESTCGPEMVEESSCGPDMVVESYCGPEMVVESSCGPEMVEESSCGPEMVEESSCGPEMVEESSCGPEMEVESSCCPETVEESSCGPEMVEESCCGPEMVEESSCGPEMEVESSCGPEMVEESSCGPEMVEESSCGPEMVEESSCAPKMMVESSCAPEVVIESSCRPEMVEESSCGQEMVEESSCGPEVVEKSSCAPEMVVESSCPPEIVAESSCHPEMVEESSCGPEMVKESSCGPEMVEESSCAPEMVEESSCASEMVEERFCGTEMVKESFCGPEMEVENSCGPEMVEESSCGPDMVVESYCAPEMVEESSCGPEMVVETSCGPEMVVESSCGPEMVEESSCGPEMVEESCCGPEMVKESSCGPEMVAKSSCGPEMVAESSCGTEMVEESSCGPEMVEESSCGPEMVVESSCGPEMVVKSSCGPEMVEESSCGPEMVEESSCGPEMEVESSCCPETVEESSCGPEMVQESCCGPEMVEESSCGPEMVEESSCGPEMVEESSCGPEMVEESSCGPEMEVESSCGPEMVEESSCGPEMVEESSCGPEMVEESSCGPEVVEESSCAPEMVVESSCAPEIVVESSCHPEMVEESSCGSEMVKESSCGPEMVEESSCAPEMVEESSCALEMVEERFCGPEMVKESFCGPEMEVESSCGPEMVKESSCGPKMVEKSSCGPEMVEESSCGPEMVKESSCGPEMVEEIACGLEMVEESSCGPEMVVESSCAPEMVIESSCASEILVGSPCAIEMVVESSCAPAMATVQQSQFSPEAKEFEPCREYGRAKLLLNTEAVREDNRRFRCPKLTDGSMDTDVSAAAAGEDKAGSCVECGARSTLRCSNCRQVFYCNRECQQQHWKKGHKGECRPFKIEKDSTLGRYLVATRDFKAGDVIFKDEPLIVGPKQLTEPVCLGCYKRVDGSYRCRKCTWPMCSPACESSSDHQSECVVGRVMGSPIDIQDFNEVNHFYEVVSPLRGLALKKRSPKKFAELLSLESHYNDRLRTNIYNENQKRVVNMLRNYFMLVDFPPEDIDASSSSIHQMTGIIDVNAADIPLAETEIIGVYPTYSLLEHSCTPNTKYKVSPSYQLTLKSAVDIRQGEHLSTCYTHILWGTAARRDHLKSTRYFMCTCRRCADPTELGTNFSALRCPKCPLGFMMSAAPLDQLADWICTSCNNTLTADRANEITLELGDDVERVLSTAKAKDIEDFIDLATATVVHPNHFHLFAARHSLLQLVGRETGLDEEKVKKKEKLCQEFLKTCTALDPGMCKLSSFAGVALYEYHLAVMARARLGPTGQQVDKMALRKDLDTAKALLQQCIKVLQEEPDEQMEGQLRKLAQQNLQELSLWECP